MFSVNRLVGRTVEREITATCEITTPRTAAPALGSVSPRTRWYPRPARPAGTGTARQIQSRVSREDSVDRVRRASHQSSREYSRFDGHFDPGESGPLDVPRTGRGRHRSRAARGACGVWASSDKIRATTGPGPPRAESSGSTATLESRSCIMRDVHANPPRDISFSDACG